MTITVVGGESSGLASMVADLIEQNLARDHTRMALLRRSVAVLDAPDADVTVFLRIERDGVRVGDGDVPDAHLRIRSDSGRLLDLTIAPLRGGFPDPLRPEGRAIVAGFSGGIVGSPQTVRDQLIDVLQGTGARRQSPDLRHARLRRPGRLRPGHRGHHREPRAQAGDVASAGGGRRPGASRTRW